MIAEQKNNHRERLSSQRDGLEALILSLEDITIRDSLEKKQETIEKKLTNYFETAPDNIIPDSTDYYDVLEYHLYRYILKHYKHKEDRVCLWRYFKTLSADQLAYQPHETTTTLQMLDWLVRIYFYSDPLDDLTCIFVPISDKTNQKTTRSPLIKKYLDWIKSYFYNVNFPTSLLWLYALDSSLASLFPDEIIYLGKRSADDSGDSLMPDFDADDAVLLKRFSAKSEHYVKLEGKNANSEFRQIFTFLQQEYKDRCLSRSAKQDKYIDQLKNNKEWEKFENVLKFGVADDNESGCISFSDLRASTEFLNTYTKEVYLSEIQQPFFEETKLISERFNGRIDKFMGDNVMCVFLNSYMRANTAAQKTEDTILNNFFALFMLCRVLCEIISEEGVAASERKGFAQSNLGLRSGVTYGDQISRANLGNEILRDFTVTGETVNLAARLEHISIPELIIHNQMYFEKTIERFPQIRELMSIVGHHKNLNPETESIINNFTLYQNILSNLEKLEQVKFDIRFNDRFYCKLKQHLQNKGYALQNSDMSEIYGYETYTIEGFELHFYFSYYNPKGFSEFKRIWLLPLEVDTLKRLDIEKIR